MAFMVDTNYLACSFASKLFYRFACGCINNEISKGWIFGFIADFIGTASMVMSNLIDFNYKTQLGKWWYTNIANAVCYNPFESVFSVLWVTVCVIITAFLIYLFNYKFCLNKLNLLDEQKKKIALSLAIFTAPYLFYLPTAWFY